MSVDSIDASQPYPKLPLRDTITLSYSTYFHHFIDALRASWLWMAVVATITGVANWRQWSWFSAAMAQFKPGAPPPVLNHMPHPLGITALLGLDNIVLTLAGVSIAVAWHRLLILGEHPGFSGSNLATRDVWRYIGIGLAIALIVMLPIMAIAFPALYFILPLQSAPGSPAAGFLLLILLVGVLYVVALTALLRLILLLPARAAGDLNLTFRQAWNRTRGNTWRLFWGVVATTFPPLFLAEIAFMLIGRPDPAMIIGEDFAKRMTATSTILVVYYLLMLPIGIGFLSHAYRYFVRAQSDPVV